jgi:hypothetical protein
MTRPGLNSTMRELDRKKYKNVSIDSDIVDILNSLADELVDSFGFRPTLSQTIRYLAKLHDPDKK